MTPLFYFAAPFFFFFLITLRFLTMVRDSSVMTDLIYKIQFSSSIDNEFADKLLLSGDLSFDPF